MSVSVWVGVSQWRNVQMSCLRLLKEMPNTDATTSESRSHTWVIVDLVGTKVCFLPTRTQKSYCFFIALLFYFTDLSAGSLRWKSSHWIFWPKQLRRFVPKWIKMTFTSSAWDYFKCPVCLQSCFIICSVRWLSVRAFQHKITQNSCIAVINIRSESFTFCYHHRGCAFSWFWHIFPIKLATQAHL